MSQTNSLKRIKLWLDVPYYVKLAGSEAKLDSYILSSGIQENDLINNYNETERLGEVFSSYRHAEINNIKIISKLVESKDSNKHIRVEKEIYQYKKGINYSAQLTRAIINTKNPALAKYGYSLYVIEGNPPNDFYVHCGDTLSLYIPIEAYLLGDYEAVCKKILFGITNIIDCTKVQEGKTKRNPLEVYEEVISSGILSNVLKLKKPKS